MANVSGTGTIWNLLNYAGDLFTSSRQSTPLLNAMGGLSNAKITNNFEYPTASNYTLATPAQPAITETASLTAAAGNEIVRDQDKNVTQIYRRTIDLSYVKLSNQNRLSGINTAGAVNNAEDEFAFQETQNQMEIARDINYTFHNGTYQIATSAAVANKTRGLITVAAANTTVAAAGADITSTILDSLILAMEAAGATFMNPVLFADATQIQKINDAFGYAPEDRNVGGTDVKQIIAPIVGNLPVVYDWMMPSGTIAIYDMAVVSPVVQPVPGKALFEPEKLAKTGAAEEWEMFGQVGLDYGPLYAHGSITGLGT